MKSKILYLYKEQDLLDISGSTCFSHSVADPIHTNGEATIDFHKNEIIEPEYKEARIKGYADPIINKLREYFYKSIGIPLKYFGDLSIRFEKFPTSYGKDNFGKKIPRGKTFGSYNPETKEIIIDCGLDPEGDCSEMEELRKHGIEVPTLERVLCEEIAHYIQDQLGVLERAGRKLGKNSRDYVEGAAAYISDMIFGKTNIYNREKGEYRKIVDRKGDDWAFLMPKDDI